MLLKEGQLYAGFLLAMKSSIIMFFVAYRRPVVFWFPLSNEIFYNNNVFQLLREGQLYSSFLLAMKSSIIMFFSCLQKANCILASS
jgi:hypothetical protein